MGAEGAPRPERAPDGPDEVPDPVAPSFPEPAMPPTPAPNSASQQPGVRGPPHHVRQFLRRIAETRRFKELYARGRVPKGDLMEITLKTAILMRQNRILQMKLERLKAETKVYLEAAANNPNGEKRRVLRFVPNLDLIDTRPLQRLLIEHPGC